MEFHPDMGYVENGIDLTNVDLYKTINQPFGQASILPPFSYQSKIFSDLEDEKLWTRNWIAIGSAHEIPNTGDLLPYTVGHHGVHVQRELGGNLIGRFNKAQHGGCRAIPLQCQTGKKTKCSFTSCGYSRDRGVIRIEEIGENTPTMHQYLGLIPERLLPVKVATWNSFVLVNLDPESSDLCDSIPILPKSTISILSNKFTLQNSEWFKCKSNWKLAGRAFFDNQNICKNSSVAQSANTLNGFSTTNLSAHELGINTENNVGGVDLFWLFPNLLLVIHKSFIVCVIIQPTSMGDCILRTSLFTKGKEELASDNVHLPPEWSSYIQSTLSRAQAMQNKTDKLIAPGAPKLTDDMIPIETSEAGHAFLQFFTKQIEIKHEYYWNAPLFSANIRC